MKAKKLQRMAERNIILMKLVLIVKRFFKNAADLVAWRKFMLEAQFFLSMVMFRWFMWLKRRGGIKRVLWLKLRNCLTFQANLMSQPVLPQLTDEGKGKLVALTGGPILERAKFLVKKLLSTV